MKYAVLLSLLATSLSLFSSDWYHIKNHDKILAKKIDIAIRFRSCTKEERKAILSSTFPSSNSSPHTSYALKALECELQILQQERIEFRESILGNLANQEYNQLNVLYQQVNKKRKVMAGQKNKENEVRNAHLNQSLFANMHVGFSSLFK